MDGYLQLRRGLLDHVESGRITSDEFAAFIYITAKADHHNGTWKGCGETLARAMHWCLRKAQRVISSLAKLGYLEIERLQNHYGAYRMRVDKYFQSRSENGVDSEDRAQKMPLISPERGHKMTTLQEVKQEALLQEKSRALNPRTVPRTEFEQWRIVEAKAKRLTQEAALRKEALVGIGPTPATLGITINPAVLQRIAERQKAASA